ncbi:hypothetical protein BB559_005441 [Furculomyces boomerangus]|uniref:Uncharacterized protein n=1 Tax=Furculomyces boomerangus TaxID=61424 RepID=A0A2T9Y8P1_9FUNG|nr:hypothetical protein BB559_005441 [Furculomyces boomerangus]
MYLFPNLKKVNPILLGLFFALFVFSNETTDKDPLNLGSLEDINTPYTEHNIKHTPTTKEKQKKNVGVQELFIDNPQVAQNDDGIKYKVREIVEVETETNESNYIITFKPETSKNVFVKLKTKVKQLTDILTPPTTKITPRNLIVKSMTTTIVEGITVTKCVEDEKTTYVTPNHTPLPHPVPAASIQPPLLVLAVKVQLNTLVLAIKIHLKLVRQIELLKPSTSVLPTSTAKTTTPTSTTTTCGTTTSTSTTKPSTSVLPTSTGKTTTPTTTGCLTTFTKSCSYTNFFTCKTTKKDVKTTFSTIKLVKHVQALTLEAVPTVKQDIIPTDQSTTILGSTETGDASTSQEISTETSDLESTETVFSTISVVEDELLYSDTTEIPLTIEKKGKKLVFGNEKNSEDAIELNYIMEGKQNEKYDIDNKVDKIDLVLKKKKSNEPITLNKAIKLAELFIFGKNKSKKGKKSKKSKKNKKAKKSKTNGSKSKTPKTKTSQTPTPTTPKV